jgi:hypothetical protein
MTNEADDKDCCLKLSTDWQVFGFCNGAAKGGQVGRGEGMIATDELPRGAQRLN